MTSLPIDWEIVPLESLVQEAQSGFASGKRDANGTIQVRMNNVTTEGNWDWSKVLRVPASEKQRTKYRLEAGNVLVNTTNSPNLVGKTVYFSGSHEMLVFSNHFVRLRLKHDRIDPNYLRRWLNVLWHRRVFEGLCTQWVNQASVRKEDLLALKIPLPPLEEQRRIATILDKADAVRRKRKEAIALSEELLQSAFLEMFGDPVTNLKGWEAITLSQIVQGEMRNGLSPSTSGTYKGQVLTLSAITQGRFNAAERKTAEFDVCPPKNKMVRKADLLVCRGNGNINLVGCARFPDTDYDDIMFPDTMIAVPINFSIIHKTYLETLWNGQSIRRQIEQQARTTNGTHKINQKVLNDIQILLPPMVLQEKFGVLYNTVKAVSARFSDSAYNNLFNSFLQRAFCRKI